MKVAGFGTPMEHHRVQGRLNSRVPVVIEWTEAAQQLRAEGYTIDISPSGCLAVVAQGIALRQRLRLINLANQNSCEAVVVWSRSEGRKGWQLGLELHEPGLDFWGLDL
jgi:c-di-GMP-binding flagellar brake protein YcgR